MRNQSSAPILRITSLALAAVLTGCAAVSPKSRLDAAADLAPDSWAASKSGQAGVDTEWVRRFGNATLTSLIDEALRQNHDLRIAATRIDQARSDVRVAASQGKPKLDLTFQGARKKQNFVGFPIGGGSATSGDPTQGGSAAQEEAVLSSLSNNFGLSLDVSWEIDVWGRIRAGTSGAVAAAQAAELDFKAARGSLAAQVAKTWFALVEANTQRQLAEEARKTYQDTAQALDERFKAGQAGESSLGAQLRLARSDVAAAEAALEQRRESVSQVARQLELLLGKYPAGAARAADNLPVLGSTPPSGLPSELLQRRPDLLAAERRLAAQTMRIKEARRAIFPRLALSAGSGTNSEELANLLNSDFGVWNLAGNAVQSILTGGQVLAEVRKRSAQETEAVATLQKSVLKAFQEVEDALQNERTLANREAALAQAATLAAEADQEARADFRRGLGDLLTVLQTQQRAVQAKSSLATVRRLRLDNRVNLHLALGGDFHVH